MQSISSVRQNELWKWSLSDFNESERVSGATNDRKIAIICGCGRSGTTLTRVILDSHSQVYAGLESLLFLPIPIIAATLAKKFAVDAQKIEEQLSQSRNKSQFIEWFISEVLRLNNKSIFADKTARNIHVLRDIWRIYPNALVVNLVRDPVDNINSLKTHPKRMFGGETGKEIVETGIVHDIEPCIERWNLAAKAALEHKGKPNLHTVQYEELVFNTEKTIREVCEFLGISFEAQMLNFTVQNTKPSRDPNRGFIQNIEATLPISKSSVGKGYNALSTAEVGKIKEETGRMFQGLVYTGPVIIPSHLVEKILGENPTAMKEGVVDSLRLHHTKDLVQPPKVYLQRTGAHTADRIISMPVYAFGDVGSAGMKWIGSHPDNHEVGLQRANAVICLNHNITNAPIAILDGTEISSERTFWMGILGIEKFVGKPKNVSILGMGKLGKMYARRLKSIFPSIQSIKCFSEAGNKIFSSEIGEGFCYPQSSWKDAIEGAEVVITTTAKGQPYIRNHDLPSSVKCIVNLSLMDFDVDVFEGSQIVVDDLSQCLQAKKIFKSGIDEGRIKLEDVTEFDSILFSDENFKPKKQRVLFNPLGMGIEDICCAKRIFDIASRKYRDLLLHL